MNTYKLYRDRLNKVWERAYFNVEAETLDDAIKLIVEDEIYPEDSELIYDTLEYLEPRENYNKATEEVYNEDDDLVYSNTLKNDSRSI